MDKTKLAGHHVRASYCQVTNRLLETLQDEYESSSSGIPASTSSSSSAQKTTNSKTDAIENGMNRNAAKTSSSKANGRMRNPSFGSDAVLLHHPKSTASSSPRSTLKPADSVASHHDATAASSTAPSKRRGSSLTKKKKAQIVVQEIRQERQKSPDATREATPLLSPPRATINYDLATVHPGFADYRF